MALITLITGAGSGIGRATAQVFLQAGHRVALMGRRRDALEETAAGHAAALILPCDVTEPEAVEAAFDGLVAGEGRLDVVFNNAGANVAGNTIDETSIEEWRKVVDVNLSGAFYVARAAFRVMRAQNPQGGRIINNGSISATAPRPGSAPYTATKHAMTGLTKTIALDGRPYDIACGQIDIGNAATEMAARMATGVPQANGAIEIEPLMDVMDVGRAVLHMAELPLGSNILFQTIMATKMPLVGRG